MALTTINRPDSEKALFGTGDDLQLYHDGSHSYIYSDNGELKLRAATFKVVNEANSEIQIKAVEDGAVELYHNNTKFFETTSSGVKCARRIDVNDDDGNGQGIAIGNSQDMTLFHGGGNSFIKNITGGLDLRSNTIHLRNEDNDETYFKAVDDGAVELYHNNVKKLTTYSAGIEIHGSEGGNCELYLYADEGDDDADNWKLTTLAASSTFQIKNRASGSWETNIECNGDGGVGLYYNNSEKVRTKSWGVEFLEDFQCLDGKKAVFGTGEDLEIYSGGTGGKIHVNNGVLEIEGDSVQIWNHAANEAMAKFTADGAVELYHNNVKVVETKTNGLAFPSGMGLDFSATANSSGVSCDSETLKDYEEGTFNLSPNLNNVSYDQQLFQYVKIGKCVHYHGRLHYDSASGTSDQILGLPFAPNQYFMTASVYVDSGFSLSDDYWLIYTDASASRLHVVQQSPAAGYNLPGAADIYITGFYFTDS